VKLKLCLAAALVLLACGGCERPTSGARIPVYDRPQIALVVVGGRFPSSDDDPPIAATNRLIEGTRRLGVELVYVRAQANADPDPRLQTINDQVFRAMRGDAFSNPDLDRFFRSRAVDHLVLIGIGADTSIELTGRGALNRGYKVMVVGDAVSSASDADRERALESLRRAGAEITRSETVLAEWARRKRYLGSR
jgi:hypothetical protein